MTENASTTPEISQSKPAPEVPAPKPAPKAAKPKASKPKAPEATYPTIDSGNPKEFARFILPKDESSVNWDYKMEIPVPQGLIDTLSVEGWDESMPVKVKLDPDTGNLVVFNGRTKLRAVPEVNKRRAKHKLPPLQIPYAIETKRNDTAAVLQGHRLNYQTQDIDPITTAKEIQRLLGVPKDPTNPESDVLTEADLTSVFNLSVKEIQEHYALLQLPPKVQKLIAEGRMTVSAALELVHLDASKVEDAAAKIVAVAESGGQATREAARKAAGKTSGTDRMSPKDVKQLVKELKAADIKGKHGGQVRRAAILALETYLDADKAEEFWGKLNDLGKE